MKHLLYFTAFLFLLVSCNQKDKENRDSSKNAPSKKIEPIVVKEQYIKNETLLANNIEVISYKSRSVWDTINENGIDYYENTILKKGRMEVFKKNTLEKISLNKTQKEVLLGILYNTNCLGDEPRGCYEPRHSFIFYNNDRKPFAAIEVCLDCYSSRETKGIKEIEFCDEKIEKLKAFLKSIGIKHFEEK